VSSSPLTAVTLVKSTASLDASLFVCWLIRFSSKTQLISIICKHDATAATNVAAKSLAHQNIFFLSEFFFQKKYKNWGWKSPVWNKILRQNNKLSTFCRKSACSFLLENCKFLSPFLTQDTAGNEYSWNFWRRDVTQETIDEISVAIRFPVRIWIRKKQSWSTQVCVL